MTTTTATPAITARPNATATHRTSHNLPTYRTTDFIAHDLANWVASMTFDALSPGAIDAARRFWIDSIGCAIGGSRTEDAHILLEHHRAMSGVLDGDTGRGPCGVFVGGFRTNPVDAAFLNSHLVRAMDFNDIYWKADPCHPSDLICGPLALCQYLGLTGRDLILATVLTYELQCRFAEIGRPGIREYGWHHATLSGFTAALVCGRVLSLSPAQLVNALGICASRTGTLGAVTAGGLTMMKNTVDPWAARMGVESALLAQRGFTGPAHIIDGKEGLFHAMGHASARTARGGEPCTFDREGLTRNLPATPADHYRIIDCSMKSFPVEALMHSPLSVLMSLRAEHSIDAAFVTSQIESVTVEVIARAADILGDPAKYRPTTRETADHSLPYALAVGLIDGAVTPAQFDEHRVSDPALRPVMDLIRIVPNTDFEARFPASQPSRVTITLRNGRTLSAQVDYPKGDPRNPMTGAEIEAKFRSLAEPVLGTTRVARLLALLNDLAEAPELESLIAATCASAESENAAMWRAVGA